MKRPRQNWTPLLRISRKAALVVLVAALLGSIYSAYRLFENIEAMWASGENRQQSLILADELRQSSDDLTRFVRTYVVTGNARYLKQFNDVLDIRNGTVPRPENYHQIYWDLITDNATRPQLDKKRGLGPAHSLTDKLIAAGVQIEEIRLLEMAKRNSDNLVALEKIAIRAAQGTMLSSDELLRNPGESNREMALRLLHGDDYHNAKAEVMAPIQTFLLRINKRTFDVHTEKRRAAFTYFILTIILVAVGALGAVAGFTITNILARADQVVIDAKNREIAQFEKAINEHAVVSIADSNLRIVDINEKFSSLSGFEKSEVLGKGHSVIGSDKNNAEVLTSIYTNIKEGRVWRGELEFKSKVGDPFWAQTTISPFLDADGKILRVFSLFTDITRRRTMELELQEINHDLEAKIDTRTREVNVAKDAAEASHRTIRDLLESVTVGVVHVDKDSNLIYWNKVYQKLLGFPDGFLKSGMSGREVLTFLAERGDYGPGDVDELVEARFSNLWNMNFDRLKLSDDRFYDVRTNNVADGGIVVTFTDISRFKEYEDELVEARDASDSANKAKSQFLANMSHEIRTPMNGVVGMAELLGRTELNDEQTRMVGTIQNSSLALLRIIDDILDVTKIEAGKLSLEETRVGLRQLAERVIEPLRIIATENNVQLFLNYDPNLPDYIISDLVRFRQILTNLLNNAIKFTRREKDAEPGRVELRLFPENENVLRIEVRDNGVGMDPETVDRLFQPFMQAEDSTTREFGGTGLGLAITSNLVNLMQGNIFVESELGKGTVFSVRLPLVGSEGQLAEADLSGINVLAFTDGKVNTDLAQKIMADKDANMTFFEDEELFFEAVQNENGRRVTAVALGTAEEHERVQRRLDALGLDIGTLHAVENMAENNWCVLPNCFKIQRFPILPGDLFEGVAVLGGRKELSEYDFQTADPLAAGGSKNLARGRVLLVEDNVTNQDVISTQLKLLGHEVEIASDGNAGINLWHAGDFDLILSDCHMPVMDGFEMTKRIRTLEREAGSKAIPIIAVTANALQGEAQKCLNSGMDDYLSKPIQLQQLQDALENWLNKLAINPDLAHDNNACDNTPTKEDCIMIDPTRLTAIVGDDPAIHKQFLTKFVSQAADIVAEIDAAYAAQETLTVGELGHKLKSSARTVGADPFADLCAELEEAGKGGDWSKVVEVYGNIDDLFAKTKSTIQEMTG